MSETPQAARPAAEAQPAVQVPVRVVATDAALALIAELTAQFISRARAFTDTEVAALRRAGHSPRPAALPQKENTR